MQRGGSSSVTGSGEPLAIGAGLGEANVTICQLLTRRKRASGYPWTILAVPVGCAGPGILQKGRRESIPPSFFSNSPRGGR